MSWWFWPDVPPVVWLPSLMVSAVAAGLSSFRPPSPHSTATALALAAAASLTSTVGWLYTARLESGAWVYLQTIALLLLITMTVRRCQPVTAFPVVTAATVADAVLAIQIMGPQLPMSQWFGICLFWSIGAAGAIGLGFYLRALDVRAAEAVTDARRVQRRQLAGDLHDFVAHDVSAMVLQAQAAQVVLDTDTERAAEALRRIETDGARALSSMDRSIQLLRAAGPRDAMTPNSASAPPATPPPEPNADSAELTAAPPGPSPDGLGPVPALPGSGGEVTPVPGLAELAELIERFAADHAGAVELRLDCHPRDVPRDLGAVVYRVAVEALTNVRRHASTYCHVSVDVSLVAARDVVECVIANTVTAGPPSLPSAHGRGGFGLAALAEQIGALGGRFTAGPAASEPPAAAGDAAHGRSDRDRRPVDPAWAVRAVLPLVGPPP